MNPNTIRILFVIFLLAHGWVHASLAWVPVPQPGAPRTPFYPSWWRSAIDPAWPASKLGLAPQVVRTLGWVLWLAVVALFTLAAAMLLISPGNTGLWQAFVVGGSAVSLLLLVLYWHPWLPVGILIDIALIAAVLLRWPFLRFGS